MKAVVPLHKYCRCLYEGSGADWPYGSDGRVSIYVYVSDASLDECSSKAHPALKIKMSTHVYGIAFSLIQGTRPVSR